MFFDISDGLVAFPASFHAMKDYFDLYRFLTSTLFAASALVEALTFFVIWRFSTGLWTTYKYLLCVMLAWRTLLGVFAQLPSKPVVVTPCSVVINVGWSAYWSPTWTTVTAAGSMICVFVMCGTISTSFAFNYALVSRQVLQSRAPVEDENAFRSVTRNIATLSQHLEQ